MLRLSSRGQAKGIEHGDQVGFVHGRQGDHAFTFDGTPHMGGQGGGLGNLAGKAFDACGIIKTGVSTPVDSAEGSVGVSEMPEETYGLPQRFHQVKVRTHAMNVRKIVGA